MTPSPDDDRAPEAVARAVANRDPQLSELLLAECARLRDDTDENRERERALLFAAEPRQARYRAQFQLITSRLFDQNVTVIDDGDRAYAWVYDDDSVSLDMGIEYDRKHPEEDPWSRNVTAIESLERAVVPRVSSIRLCLFEGTKRMSSALAAHRAADRVTHLDLRTQSTQEPEPVACIFPALRGLSCMPVELATLLAEGAPELRALVVWLDAFKAPVLALAEQAPKLEHLGLQSSAPSASDLVRLARHPILARLTSLDLSDTNHASTFPFETLIEHHAAFAHLARLDLPGHLVPATTLARVREVLPRAGVVAFDRRETMALDFELTGWGASAR